MVPAGLSSGGGLGQEVYRRRLVCSDLSPWWSNIEEDNGGRAKAREYADQMYQFQIRSLMASGLKP